MSGTVEDETELRESGLARGLSQRQLTMIGIGGAIGTGLFMGSSLAIGYAGPGVLLSYLIAAFIAIAVMFSLSEIAVAKPTAGSFGTYAEIFISPLAGWIVRWTYWCEMVVLIGSEAVAVGHYLSFWLPWLPIWASTLISGSAITVVNTRAVNTFGSIEYWLSSIKVAAILAFIILGLGMITGVNGQPTGISNLWADGGPLPFGFSGVALGTMVAIFSFFGIEMVAVAAGEASNPAKAIPRAMRTLLVRLCLFYLLAIAIILAIVPWHSSAEAVADQSPFVKVFVSFGIPVAASMMNFVVLCAALSAMNSSLYMSSRMLFSLARAGHAPARFGQLNTRSVPAYATFASAGGIFIATVVALCSPRAFEYMVGLALFGGLSTWSFVLVTHFRFRAQTQIASLTYRAPFYPLPQILGLIGLIAIAFIMIWSGNIWRMAVMIGVPWTLLIAMIYVLRERVITSRARRAE